MRKMGMAEDDVDKLVCPIGLTDIKDKAPAAIAASVVAQVLIARETPMRSGKLPRTRRRGMGGVMAETGVLPGLRRC